MKLPALFRRWKNKLLAEVDQMEAEKAMISSIQKLVGIHNVCGDKHNETTFMLLQSCLTCRRSEVSSEVDHAGLAYAVRVRMVNQARLRFSILALFSIILFGGTFIYVGTFSQLVYLVQVFPDKMESFKVINCVSATSVPLSKYIFMWTARSRLRVIFELSREGVSSLPGGSSAHATMTKTLHTARHACWFVVFNQAGTHITFLITVTATAFSAINQTGYIVLFVTLLAHELGHFYSITETLNEIYHILKSPDQKTARENTETQESVNKKLKFCIKHHQFLVRYHQKICELYKMIFGAHFLMMTIVLVTTLQTMNEWDIRNTILTAATGILPLFIYCFGGELLITAGEEMSAAVYSCGWELMGNRQARSVVLVLCLSQRPLCLTAADIFVMNRETFGNVAQVVYKIYA
ncbi:Olfactory receptor, partial [Operophtera brumata]